MRERSQNKKLQKVIKERDALRKQLAYLSKAAKEDSSEEDTASCSSNSSSMSQSSSCSSSSSSDDDDDDDKMRRKGKGKAKLRLTKNKKKMKKHHKADVRKRARGPFEVIRRYKKVLKAYNRGLKLSAACAYAGVNELTVRSTASIAELATASPGRIHEAP
ncbi:ADP-ribosylation factor-like protein 6-interacting protein 4 [Eleginops maclovinus]|uniref:ADP-ribosylation factor-like protein 6-interacting protein 4 n=1 Tax=Eleginops maclovinus TaxID=56733 RepID=UPI00307FFA84